TVPVQAVEQYPKVPVAQAVTQKQQGSRLHDRDEISRDYGVARAHPPEERDVILLGDDKGVVAVAPAVDMSVDLEQGGAFEANPTTVELQIQKLLLSGYGLELVLSVGSEQRGALGTSFAGGPVDRDDKQIERHLPFKE